ncbi:hypothetical protein LG047_02580 [Methylocystis sp. WRRC1]|uniref:hypothetical protein n=1 Tax=Methylocystis sp. WRRC1 TaxID=1732014 RepID=UPI001D147DFA|nr:hypothetical protein [Methylocystis sp. WRRC1]MCC3244217.1 hypothetical protein [Methylocystis sp. WRRC1]
MILVGVAGEQFPSKINALSCQTGQAASTDFKGLSGPLSNRASSPDPQKETAALGVGAQRGGEILKDRKNLRRQYTAPAGRGAIGLSWRALSYDQRELWLGTALAIERPGGLPSWAHETAREVWKAGVDNDFSAGVIFALDTLLRLVTIELGLAGIGGEGDQ